MRIVRNTERSTCFGNKVRNYVKDEHPNGKHTNSKHTNSKHTNSKGGKHFIMRLFSAVCAASLLLMSALYPISALANTSKKGEADTEPAVIVETSANPIPTAPVETNVTVSVDPVPFSVPGNAEVLDDIADNSKEFYIIETKNNETFYLVIDKAATSENVYMLSMIDENDLAAFIDGAETEKEEEPQDTPAFLLWPQANEEDKEDEPVILPTEPDTVPAEDEPQPDASTLFLLGVLGVIGIVCLVYYFRVYKPRKEDMLAEDEDLDEDDGFQ